MAIKKEKWELELEVGNVWRAKEILRSLIRWNYDTKIYFAYGKILYDVKDYYEAGKYLFIAGEPIDGKYKDAIDIFLKRHQYTDSYHFISNFPRRFVQENFDNYSENVQEYLKTRGYEKKKLDKFKENNQYIQSKETLKSKIIFFIIMGLFLLTLYLGAKSILEWLMHITFFEVDKCLDAGGAWDYNKSRCDITY